MSMTHAALSSHDRRRRDRFAAQRVLWRISQHQRVRSCGSAPVDGARGVQLRVSGPVGARHGGFAGLQNCGSVWSCAVCSARILGKRQGEIALAVERWRADGGKVAMATFTMKHNQGQTLDTLWRALGAGWTAVTSGGTWSADKSRLGVASCRQVATGKYAGQWVPVDVLPWLRVVEVTHGAKGWHVHVHMVVFLPRGTTRKTLADLYDSMWSRWEAGLRSVGVDGSIRVNRADFYDDEAAETLGAYVSKNTYSASQRVGLEVARGDLKDGRWSNRSAFQILRDLVLQPEGSRPERDAGLWEEFELASLGKRQMTWAAGSRDVLDLSPEQTDEEIADEETGTVDDTVITIPVHAFLTMNAVAGRRVELLELAEACPDESPGVIDLRTVAALLDRWGVEWIRGVMPEDD